MKKLRLIALVTAITLFVVLQISAQSSVNKIVRDGYLTVTEVNGTAYVGDVNMDKTLPLEDLREAGLKYAQGLGIQGQPETEEIFVMSLSTFYAASQSWSFTQLSPESPTYIYRARGKMERPQMIGLSEIPEDTVFEGVEIVFDALTGIPIEVGIAPAGTKSTNYKEIPAVLLQQTIVPATLVPPPPLTDAQKAELGLSGDQPLSVPAAASQ